jgi:hypothetical protein
MAIGIWGIALPTHERIVAYFSSSSCFVASVLEPYTWETLTCGASRTHSSRSPLTGPCQGIVGFCDRKQTFAGHISSIAGMPSLS